MCVKMNYMDIDKICQIDIKKLYEEVKGEQLAFHQWPKWLSAKICRIYMDNAKQAKKVKRPQKSVLDNPHVKKEVASHHYFAAFSLNFEYFYSNI